MKMKKLLSLFIILALLLTFIPATSASAARRVPNVPGDVQGDEDEDLHEDEDHEDEDEDVDGSDSETEDEQEDVNEDEDEDQSDDNSEERVREDREKRENELKEEATDRLEEFNNASDARKLEALKKYGVALVERRINSLDKVIDLIEDSEYIDEASKAELLRSIMGEIDALKDVKEQIEAFESGDDIDDLKGIIRSLFEDEKVYGVIVPKYHGLHASNVMLGLIEDHILTKQDKLEEIIVLFEDAELDTAELERLVNKFLAEIDSAQAKILQAIRIFTDLSPEMTYGEARTEIDKAKNALKDAKGHLRAAKQTLGEIRELIEEMKGKLDRGETDKEESEKEVEDDSDSEGEINDIRNEDENNL